MATNGVTLKAMRYELSLIVLTIVSDSIRNCLSLRDHKQFRSNSTNIKSNSKLNSRKEELFKLKKILRRLNNRPIVLTSPIYLSARTNAAASSMNPLSTQTPAVSSTARKPIDERQSNERRRGWRRRRRRRRRRRNRKNNDPVFARLNLVLRRQRFQQFFRSSVKASHRSGHSFHRNRNKPKANQRTGLKAEHRTGLRTRNRNRSSFNKSFFARRSHQNRRQNTRNKHDH